MFRYAQRNARSPAPSEHACEAVPRLRQSVSPSTRNDHLSLARINEDDRWGRLAALTEAPRQEPQPQRWPPTRQDTERLQQDDVLLAKKEEGFEKKIISLVYVSCKFPVFASGPENVSFFKFKPAEE